MQCETVKVVSPKSPGGYVVINKSDFDEKVHKLYTEPKAEPAQDDSGKGDDSGKSGKGGKR